MNPQEQNSFKPTAQQISQDNRNNNRTTALILFLFIFMVAIFSFINYMQKSKEIDEIEARINQTTSVDEENNSITNKSESNEIIFQDTLLKDKRVLMMYSGVNGISDSQLFFIVDCNKDFEKCLEIASDADMSAASNEVANQIDGDTLSYLFYRCDVDTCSWFGNRESGTWVIVENNIAKKIDFKNGELELKGEYELNANMGDISDIEVLDDGIKVQYTKDEVIYSEDYK